MPVNDGWRIDEQGVLRPVAGAAAPVGGASAGGPLPRLRRRFDRTLFAEDLSELLQAGLPVREALDAMASRGANPSDRRVLRDLQRRLHDGAPLSEALGRHVDAFGPVLVALVRAGETTSSLESGLVRFAQASRRVDALRSHVQSAMLYPAVLFTVAGAVALFLAGWVVPRFAQVIDDGGAQLSDTSRWLVTTGRLIGDTRGLWMGLIAAFVLGMAAVFASARSRAWLAERLQALPGVGQTLRWMQAVRFFSAAATLVGGGLPAVQAFELAAALLDGGMRARLLRAVDAMKNGAPLAVAMGPETFDDPVVPRLLDIAQRTGDLAGAMQRIALLFDARVTRRVDRTLKLFEPVLMVFIGAVIGGVVLLMYLPILELSSSVR